VGAFWDVARIYCKVV